MKRLIFPALAGLLWIAATPGAARADDTLKRVQQSLRDQGFYYGTIDGSPGDETTQAIRRYQIRNGLQVSGQLNEETRASILRSGAGGNPGTGGGNTAGSGNGSGAGASPGSTVRPRSTPSVAASTPRPLPTATPVRTTIPPSVRADPDDEGGFRRGNPANPPSYRTTPDREDEDGYRRPTGSANPPAYRTAPDRDDEDATPVRPGAGRDPRDVRTGRVVPADGVASSPALSNLFADTPYEFAPPPVQADTLRRAQNRLFRQGFYDREGTGRPDAVLPEALSNFQSFNHLRRTGRLDTATLAALHLLPERGRGGQNGAYPGDDAPRRGGGVFEGRVVQ